MALPFLQTLIVFFFLAQLPVRCAAKLSSPALRCEQHAAYRRKSFISVLVHWWSYGQVHTPAEQEVYLARYKRHGYAPVNARASKKYIGLDLFNPLSLPDGPSLRMYFQRPALVYLFLMVRPARFEPKKRGSLSGWKSEGWAVRVVGGEKLVYGVHAKNTVKLKQHAYVFSKLTGSNAYVDVPTNQELKKGVKKVSVSGKYVLWIAEKNGSPSPPVGTFRGKKIAPNKKCPDELHDVWTVKDNNREDRDTAGVKFKTWHPHWDPCFWCAYDHDHGASPKEVMGYVPKFGYAAWKNKREAEAHAGFKGFVFTTGEYLVYYCLHAQTSNPKRVETQFHSVIIAVAHRRTKEILVDLNQKGDFGFSSVQLRRQKVFLPLTAAQKAIEKSQGKGPKNFRSVTVLNLKHPNLDYRTSRRIRTGVYEYWRTLPMCSKGQISNSGFTVVFRGPSTGIRSIDSVSRVDLGRYHNGNFYKSTGLSRFLKTTRMRISSKHCPGRKSGKFYTNPEGTVLRSGPGRSSVLQYIKPGFTMFLDRAYDTALAGLPTFKDMPASFFADHGYGINPDLN